MAGPPIASSGMRNDNSLRLPILGLSNYAPRPMATFTTRLLGCMVSFADEQAIRERLLVVVCPLRDSARSLCHAQPIGRGTPRRGQAARRKGPPRGRAHRFNLGCFRDQDAGLTHAGLIREAGAIEGRERLRLSSIEISHVTRDLIDAIRETRVIARHPSLSGSLPRTTERSRRRWRPLPRPESRGCRSFRLRRARARAAPHAILSLHRSRRRAVRACGQRPSRRTPTASRTRG